MVLRRMLPFAVAAGVAATLATVVPAVPAVADSAPIQLTLPAPTGPHQIGTVSLHLVQQGRRDPYVPDIPYRELMVSLTYPARHAGRYPTAPYMTAHAWASGVDGLGAPAGSLIMPQTAAHEGAPVDRHHGGLPVVLFTGGAGETRTDATAIVQELASRGYLVVTIDHTYDEPEVDFPDGRVEHQHIPPDPDNFPEPEERAKDTSFVLDALSAIDHGHNPDVDHQTLPRGLRGALDMNRVGMFTHSLGGQFLGQAMLDDPRIKAGAFLDGKITEPVTTTGLNQPFLRLSQEGRTHVTDTTHWGQVWDHSPGWKRDLQLVGSGHETFVDGEFIITQAASVISSIPPDELKADVGTIDPARAFTVESRYMDAFFDRHLRHHAEPVLDGPTPQFPEITFTP
jgi:dienelactone hydrolase